MDKNDSNFKALINFIDRNPWQTRWFVQDVLKYTERIVTIIVTAMIEKRK